MLSNALSLAVPVVVALAVHGAAFRLLPKLARRSPLAGDIAQRCRRSSRLFVVLFAVSLAIDAVHISSGADRAITHGLSLAMMARAAWLIINVAFVVEDLALNRFQVDVADNLRARKVRTQVLVLRRVTVAVVTVLAVAAMLTTFPEARALGNSLLASAGIVGIVAGIAAKSTFGNIIAGIQMAFTEPIRLDDVVVVEGEWGRVEEITLTYVVVRIWDSRRLILPLSHFVESPFENWTRNSADLLGAVMLNVDYSVPVDEVRNELHRILRASPRWDGRVCALQATGTTEATVELRALMSAADSATTFDLRCEVREALIDFLQRHYPNSLPRLRVEADVPVVMGAGRGQ